MSFNIKTLRETGEFPLNLPLATLKVVLQFCGLKLNVCCADWILEMAWVGHSFANTSGLQKKTSH